MSQSIDRDAKGAEGKPEPQEPGPLPRDPPPPPGYVDPLEQSEILEEGLPASNAALRNH